MNGESIIETYMKMAIEQAKVTKSNREWIGGSIIVKDSKVISRTPNSVVSKSDPTAHCEINALRSAAKKINSCNLEGCDLYTTSEACPMCCSACVWAGINRIFYGLSLEDLMELGDYQIKISSHEVINKSFHKIELTGGVLRTECLDLFKN